MFEPVRDVSRAVHDAQIRLAMCGIAHIKNLRDRAPVNAAAKLMYFNQKSRGTNGYGLVGMNNHTIETHRALKESDFLSRLTARPYDEILLHHRLPTSTKNTYASTHPFVMELDNRRYYFVHNGIIENAHELREQHYQAGITYRSMEQDGTFNDSESLAWEFALYLCQRKQGISAVGSVACICLETDRESNRARRLYFYHNNGSPLRMLLDSELLVLSSEGGWGSKVAVDKLFFYDYQTKTLKLHSPLTISDELEIIWYGQPALDWDEDDDGVDVSLQTSVQAEIRDLELERDYLVSAGDYDWAQELDQEIADLRSVTGTCR